MADLATAMVIGLQRLDSSERAVGHLEQALASRVAVEQAKGVLAQRHGVTVGAARESLRRHARDRHRTVVDVAGDVVSGDVDPMAELTD